MQVGFTPRVQAFDLEQRRVGGLTVSKLPPGLGDVPEDRGRQPPDVVGSLEGRRELGGLNARPAARHWHEPWRGCERGELSLGLRAEACPAELVSGQPGVRVAPLALLDELDQPTNRCLSRSAVIRRPGARTCARLALWPGLSLRPRHALPPRGAPRRNRGQGGEVRPVQHRELPGA